MALCRPEMVDEGAVSVGAPSGARPMVPVRLKPLLPRILDMIFTEHAFWSQEYLKLNGSGGLFTASWIHHVPFVSVEVLHG